MKAKKLEWRTLENLCEQGGQFVVDGNIVANAIAGLDFLIVSNLDIHALYFGDSFYYEDSRYKSHNLIGVYDGDISVAKQVAQEYFDKLISDKLLTVSQPTCSTCKYMAKNLDNDMWCNNSYSPMDGNEIWNGSETSFGCTRHSDISEINN